MTTENITTENEVKQERSINELLNLETYQDMTDEEIDRVIEFKIKTEVMRRMSDGTHAMNTLVMEQLIADNKASCERSHAMLESILNRKPVLQRVEV